MHSPPTRGHRGAHLLHKGEEFMLFESKVPLETRAQRTFRRVDLWHRASAFSCDRPLRVEEGRVFDHLVGQHERHKPQPLRSP
jgi:hypothetical protein